MNEKISARVGGKKTFHAVLIKPSHYDDDGYVIQWRNSVIPSNSLAVLYGLSQDLATSKVLGDDTEILVSAYDETNTRIPVDKIIEQIQSADGGFVGFTGVQSNQFPRTMDMAARFRRAGIQVCIGGFHISGCISMLKDLPPDIKRAMEMGVSLFAGEAEGGRLEGLFKDAYAGALKPLYNYLNELPAIESQPVPYLPNEILNRYAGALTSFDAGRGCPFKCSFCTIINVQGRKSRRRSADDVESIIKKNAARGYKNFFITDDNFARNRDWEAIFDRIIKLKETDGISINFTIQVDTMSHRIPGFIEKAGKAGVARVFIGLENINPENLKSAGKGQNKIAEYRRMLQAWRSVRAITCAGYILGFPGDTRESIVRDIKTIQRELPVDLLEFFLLTPLPGSEDHRGLAESGVWMDPDMNNYDLNHVTTKHPIMTSKEWKRAYHAAWDTYYTPKHIETVLKRTKANNMGIRKTMFILLWFYSCMRYEGVHPLEGGHFRRKYRLDRRPGLPIESPIIFYPKRLWQMAFRQIKILPRLFRCFLMIRRIKSDPDAANYTDEALMPVSTESDNPNEHECDPEQMRQSN